MSAKDAAEACATTVAGLLDAHRPTTLLAVGELAAALALSHCEHHPECAMELADSVAAVRAIPIAMRYDFGIVSGTLEGLSLAQGGVLLSRLRDLLVRRLALIVVVSPVNHGVPGKWRHTDLLSYGLRLRAKEKRDQRAIHLYTFDIEHYKTTPEWLSPRNWAHPENFDRFRW